jgi:hypothetical protein
MSESIPLLIQRAKISRGEGPSCHFAKSAAADRARQTKS